MRRAHHVPAHGRRGKPAFLAGPGQVVVVPAGNAHKFANGGDTKAVARVVVTPALDMEELFETTVALADEAKAFKSGMPKPVHLALFVHRFRNEVRAPFPPAPLQRAALMPLAIIGRLRGHARRYGRPRHALALGPALAG